MRASTASLPRTTTTAAAPTVPARTAVPVKTLLRTSATALVLGAAAAEAVSLTARAFDVPLRSSGFGDGAAETIPVGGFALATLMYGLIGVALAFALRRWAKTPARTFTRVCVALTALSFVPLPVVNHTATSTRIVLALTHIAAAVVIVPMIARRLADRSADAR
ncbi:DUF6069 family protein [Yinghuangia seranimata]|uniref:DUF6069 family protein n=1 Tax=Yinghuangia seranimata TaxID=408067 RepID=UPI00248D08F3|nr:DUF6069 family protein [Yinghuangia seranimata]MDI2125223.1 DUF6069 family protein [Yinghuangia seranimata]